VLGIAVLAVTVFARRHPSNQGAVAGKPTGTPSGPISLSTSAAPPPTARSSSPAPRGSSSVQAAGTRPPLVVLNNTTVTGLAEQAAQRFTDGGWTVTSFGNYQNDILSTCAYYDPSVPGAREAAQALQRQYPTIKRVQPKFAELPAGPIVVVLTPDYS
jgi:hypothetical protein